MRHLLFLPAALALAACNQSEPAGRLEGRVNLAAVAPAKARAVMHERHEGMEKIGKLMKQLSRDMKAEPLNLAAVRPSAAAMNGLAQKSAGWFPAGTGPDVGKTRAKADIWQKPQDFAAKMASFQKLAAALDSSARGGNAAATQAAFGQLGQSCKACHDAYRGKGSH